MRDLFQNFGHPESSRIGFMMAAGLQPKIRFWLPTSPIPHTNFYWQVVLAEYMDHHDFEGHGPIDLVVSREICPHACKHYRHTANG